MAKFRVRDNRGMLLFDTNITLGWRVVRDVSFAAGEAKVESGEWQRVYDAAMNHIGYQPMKGEKPIDEGIPSIHSCASISRSETEINAGLRGESHTAGMVEMERSRRIARGLMPEDKVERVVAKIRVWKKLGAKRGDIARVWPK